MLKKHRALKLFFISFAITFVFSAIFTIAIYAYNNSISVIRAETEKGVKYLEANDFARAEAAFKNALGKDATYAPARLGLSDAYFRQGKVDDSIKVLNDGIELVPGYYDYYSALIKVYTKANRLKEAFDFMSGITTEYIRMKLNEYKPIDIIASPGPSASDSPINVKLESSANCTIYYSLDGNIPSFESKQYSAPIKISAKTTVRAFAINAEGLISNEFNGFYNVFNGTSAYTFSDKKVEAMVRAALNRESGSIFLNDLASITRLSNVDSSGKPMANNITVLDDFSAFSSLAELSLKNEPSITNFSPLTSLTSLKKLTLGGCNIDDRDFNTICSMKWLNNLTADNNSISNISGISALSELRNLSLSTNIISDVSPLANLTKLATLNLSNNVISDVTKISLITGLTNLNLSGNRIAVITPLTSLQKVQILNLNNNKLTNITDLNKLTSLENFSIAENSITDLSPLNNMTTLRTLDLSFNKFIDLAPLGTLKLTSLTLTNNNISDVTVISHIYELSYLSLKNNSIIDIYPLSSLDKLETLFINDNLVVDIAPLKGCSGLKTVYCSGNPIADKTALNGTSITVYSD